MCLHFFNDAESTIWGPVVTDPAASNWVGVSRPTNSTGQISAIYYAIICLCDGTKAHTSEAPDNLIIAPRASTGSRTTRSRLDSTSSPTSARFTPTAPAVNLLGKSTRLRALAPRKPLGMQQLMDSRPESFAEFECAFTLRQASWIPLAR